MCVCAWKELWGTLQRKQSTSTPETRTSEAKIKRVNKPHQSLCFVYGAACNAVMTWACTLCAYSCGCPLVQWYHPACDAYRGVYESRGTHTCSERNKKKSLQLHIKATHSGLKQATLSESRGHPQSNHQITPRRRGGDRLGSVNNLLIFHRPSENF